MESRDISKPRIVAICAVYCLLAGLLAGGVMAFIDWRANPGGIFRDSAGTHWRVVFETAWSWAWPVALLVAAILPPIVLACYFVRRRG